MNVRTTDLETLAKLFEALSKPAPNFCQPWEYDEYLKKQRLILCEIAQHQNIALVYSFCEKVDAPSRTDADIWVTLRRAIGLAPYFAIQLRAYINRQREQVSDKTTGDPTHDKWAEDAHLNPAQEWETNVLRYSAEYETDFRGYIREKR